MDIMIAGVGGQGTVLASKLIAGAAMKKGFAVRTTETIGMAQRGGSVVSHVRIGENIFSPLIPLGKADALIAFEPAEAVRQLPYLSANGALIVCDTPVKSNAKEMTDYLKKNVAKLTVIDGKQIINSNGAKTMNTVLLGAATKAGIFPFEIETLKETISEMVKEQFLEMNLKAIKLGSELI